MKATLVDFVIPSKRKFGISNSQSLLPDLSSGTGSFQKSPQQIEYHGHTALSECRDYESVDHKLLI